MAEEHGPLTPLAFVRPSKPIAEMDDAEIDDLAAQLFSGIAAALHPNDGTAVPAEPLEQVGPTIVRPLTEADFEADALEDDDDAIAPPDEPFLPWG